jgi:two-component system, chemotaxis family, protein-glutamate methylesterase/glutaminase
MRINVLVVDDSAFMRRAITKMLEGEPDVMVCGTARNGDEAVLKAQQLHPDVITMDVEMPGMGGLDAVREIMSRADIPIIMVSALTQEGAETTFRALDLGAVDFIAKPDAAYVNIKDVARDLVAKVRVFARRGTARRITPRPKVALPPLSEPPLPRTPAPGLFDCVAIGTSTGGPVALSRIVPALPQEFPTPIVIVQHMPPGFTRPLADRLNASSKIAVAEGQEGMVLRKGQAIIAPAGRQLVLRRVLGSDEVEVQLRDDDGRSLHVPSVDVMAASVAEMYGGATLAAILTGMGQDGVVGLRKVKDSGGFVIGQDAATSVVYGMPRAAAQAGLVDRVLPLDQIAPALCELTNTTFARS